MTNSFTDSHWKFHKSLSKNRDRYLENKCIAFFTQRTNYLGICLSVRAVSAAAASCSTSCWMLSSARWRCDGSNPPSEAGACCCWPPWSRCCSICCRCSACISLISRRCSLSCCCCCSSNCCCARWRCSKLFTTNPPPPPRPDRDRPDSSPTHSPLLSCAESFITSTSWMCCRVTCNHQLQASRWKKITVIMQL